MRCADLDAFSTTEAKHLQVRPMLPIDMQQCRSTNNKITSHNMVIRTLGHFLHSRIPPVENGPFRLDFFDWILLAFLIVTRVDFIFFVLFLEAVGVREYCCTAAWQHKNRLAALCFGRSPRATRASCATNPRPSRLVALDLSQKPPKLRLWRCTQQSYSRRSRCWQDGIDTARCCRRVIHAAGERS